MCTLVIIIGDISITNETMLSLLAWVAYYTIMRRLRVNNSLISSQSCLDVYIISCLSSDGKFNSININLINYDQELPY